MVDASETDCQTERVTVFQRLLMVAPYRGGGSSENRRAMKILARLSPAKRKELRDAENKAILDKWYPLPEDKA